VAELVKADLGWVILFGVIAGIPAMILSGPYFGRYIAGKIHVKVPDTFQALSESGPGKMPGFAMVTMIIFIPLFLILLNTLSGILLEGENVKAFKSFLGFIGHPFIALLIATLLAVVILGARNGFSKEELQKITTKALEPAGIIILITGAGGVFKQVLIDSGVGDVLAGMMAESTMPPVLLAFTVAAIVRVAQGSATVAMITAAGIISPIISVLQLEGAILGLIVIAISAGASILSHVNDSGFWLVNRYLGLTEQQTLRSWTVMTTILALTGLTIVFIISLFM
jgi:Gnt-I system low-affinity gluconate transporter